MKYYLTVLYLCLFTVVSFAQEDNEQAYDRADLKFSPLSLFPFPYSNLQFGWEQPFRQNPRHAMELHLGFINPFPHDEAIETRIRRMWGGIGRLGYRYYLNEREWDESQYFVSAQFFSQYESWEIRDWVTQGDGNYEQLLEYDKGVSSHGLLAIIGWKYVWPASRIGMELSFGVGRKIRKVSYRGLEDNNMDITLGDEGFSIFGEQFVPSSLESDQWQWFSAYLLGWKLTYSL